MNCNNICLGEGRTTQIGNHNVNEKNVKLETEIMINL